MENQVPETLKKLVEADEQFTTAYLKARHGEDIVLGRGVYQELSNFDIFYKEAAQSTGIRIELVNNQIRYRKVTIPGTLGVWISRKSALEQLAAAQN